MTATAVDGQVLRTQDEALEHVHAICFKTGPPRRIRWHARTSPSRCRSCCSVS